MTADSLDLMQMGQTRATTILFCVACLLLSLPLIHNVWQILFFYQFPSGGDPADHAIFVLEILKTGDPLIPYTQFPGIVERSLEDISKTYYPSFLHLVFSAFTKVFELFESDLPRSVISSMTSVMFVSYIIGVLGYCLLIKAITEKLMTSLKYSFLYGYLKGFTSNKNIILFLLLLLTFSIFIYSTASILKTFRDGGYGEIFSMWTILPFYLMGLLTRKFVLSGILIGVIASTHNISFVMALMVTFSYFITLLAARDFKLIKQSRIFFIVGFICSLPAIVLFYLPLFLATSSESTGLAGALLTWTRADIVEQVTPILYYIGLISMCCLLLINYKATGWITGWIVIYLIPFHLNLLFLERLAREISIPLGLASGIFVSSIIFVLLNTRHFESLKVKLFKNSVAKHYMNLAIVIAACSVLIPTYYAVFDEKLWEDSDPLRIYYSSNAIEEANQFLTQTTVKQNPNIDTHNETILLYGINPWLKPLTFSKYRVLEVESEDLENGLGLADRILNRQFRSVIENPNSNESIEILNKYNVRYLYFSDILPDRWYTDEQRKIGDKFSYFATYYNGRIYNLNKQITGDQGELIEIYSVMRTK